MSGPAYVVYELTPPAGMEQSPLVSLLQDQVFPAISRQSTRRGQVEGLHLLSMGDGAGTYLWVIEWNGLFPPGPSMLGLTEALQMLQAAGVEVSETFRTYEEIATG